MQVSNEYLRSECRKLLEDPNLTEGIETALPYGSGEGKQRYTVYANS